MFYQNMRKVILIITYSVLFNTYIQAQQTKEIDSLVKVLQNATTDTGRISAIGEVVKQYLVQTDSVNAFKYAYSAASLAQKVQSPLHKAYADHLLGYIHHLLQHEDSAIYYYNRLLSRLESSTDPKAVRLMIYGANNLAALYSKNGNMRKSVELLVDNLPRLDRANDKQVYEFTIHNLSESFIITGEYKKAYPYMQQNIALAEEAPQPEARINPYLSAAFLMYKMDSLSRMQQYLAKAKENLDKARPDNDYKVKYLAYKATWYAKTGQIEAANEQMEEAFFIVSKWPDIGNDFYDLYTAKEEVAAAAGNYKAAREAALLLYQKARNDKYAEILLANALLIANYSARLKDYKTAYEYSNLYASLSDSIRYTETVLEVSEMETMYKTAEKEKQITRLQGEKQQVLLENKNQQLLNTLLGTGAGVLLLIILLLAFIYRSSKKQAALQLKKVEQEQELKLIQALLDGEERERLRVARDLHDGLGGALAGIKLKLSHDPAVDEKVVAQLESSISELRRIARNLMPERLMQSGLETALKDLCASFANPKLEIEFQANGISQDIPLTTQVNIYRIIQELLANSVKHSGATKIIVQCIQEGKQFLVTVEDNGKGFSVTDPQHSNGLGLNNIHSRVKNLRGSMDIVSEIDEGTSVNIELYV